MNTIYKILLTILISIGLVGVLYFIQPKPVKNGFKRGVVYTAKKLGSLELKYNSFYINKLSKGRIYLGNTKAWLLMFSCSNDLTDTVYERLLYANESLRELELAKKNIIQKIAPGQDVFGTDGYLTSNEGQMVFTYYYRNQFVWLDKGFNVLCTGRLIDTNTVAKIELDSYISLAGKQVRTMAKPGLLVNKRGCIDGHWFYNHSALAADNEKTGSFNRHEVLDVYRLKTGRHSHSIYLPKYQDKNLSDFAVKGKLVVALYGRHLVTYALNGKEASTK